MSILDRKVFLKNMPVNRLLLAVNIIMALVYFFVLAFWFERGNPYLYWFLVLGEIYHVWQIVMYCYTVWPRERRVFYDLDYKPGVDVFITVVSEPLDILEKAIRAAKNMDYENFQVHVLNDGYVANKDNWREIEAVARRLEVNCITRKVAGGAKAGNINNALNNTVNPFIAVFDVDHVPKKSFLSKTVGYFSDPRMGFVQTPQFYKNQNLNQVTQGAWEQQELFFGAICGGKNDMNCAFMCGTNMVIRREAIKEAGGMSESITEDFLTSQRIHEKGWHSMYVEEVLAEGLAPEDMLSYYKQQFRWARGSLEIIFKDNPLFRKGLTWNQKTQYIASAGYYLSGFIVLVNALFPLIFFYTGAVPFKISTMALATAFIPYIFLTVLNLKISSNYTFTFRAVAFSMSSFLIHTKALLDIIFGRKSGFTVTPKRGTSGNFLYLVYPHLFYIALTFIGLGIAISREGFTASLMSNLSWAIFNIAVFIPFITAALPAKAFNLNYKPKYADAS